MRYSDYFFTPMQTNIKKFTALILCGWLISGLLSLAWNIYDDRREYNMLALQSARTFLAQIKNFRAWNASQGGVYVPLTKDTTPSPPFSGPEREIRTTDGALLTRINPATMTRQLSEIAALQKQAQFHITSLNPIRPENKPFPWEETWLKEFRDTGSEETGGFFLENGTSSFRYMAPMIMQQECLQCHSERRYNVGEIRGGISISLPWSQPAIDWIMVLSHLLAMAAGSTIILFFGKRLHQNRQELLKLNSFLYQEVKEREEAQQLLQTARDRLEERVNERTLELSLANRELNRKIHERAHIEEALTMIYDEFYQLFNSAPDGMLVTDRQFHILRVNQAFCKLIDLDTNSIIGRKCFELFHGEHCHTADCPLTRIVLGEQRVEMETTKQFKDRSLPCIVTSTPFREADGSLIGAIQVVKDITSLKETEQALLASSSALQKSNKALEEFAHVISHDLQEPLVLIQGFSQRLQKKAGEALPPGCDQYIQQIHGAAARMQDLVRGLLAYARVNSKSNPFEAVDLSMVLTTVLDDLALRIEECGACIASEKLPTVPADPLQMRQLLQNLIGNSLKYSHPDRLPVIKISAETIPDAPPKVRITLSDNGAGFPPQCKEKIFELFERQAPCASGAKGSGIGLAICRKIVQRHNGAITADSTDQGSAFTITLPLEEV